MTIDQIKEAIRAASPRERWELLEWLDQLANEEWDRQIVQDAKAGKLDRFLKDAEDDLKAGRVKDFP